MIPCRIPTPAERFNTALSASMRANIWDLRDHECYVNSVVAMVDVDDDPTAYYVEGWYINIAGEYAIEHGWLEIDGQVVDVTIPDGKAANYYAVCRYCADEVFAYVGADTTWPLFGVNDEAKALMKQAHAALPVDPIANLVWALWGYQSTGIKSVIIE